MIKPMQSAALALATALAPLTLPMDAMAAERALDKEVVIAAGLDQAWAAWTSREGITSFFAPEAEIDPRVGGAFHIHFNPLAAAGDKGADESRFMALQPRQMLSFDWNAPPHLPLARAQRSFVVLRFEVVDASHTRLRIHHTGWGDGGEWDKAYLYFDKAWESVLGSLRKRFETGPVDWAPWLAQLKAMAAAPAPAPVLAPAASR